MTKQSTGGDLNDTNKTLNLSIDELLSKNLDNLLFKTVSTNANNLSESENIQTVQPEGTNVPSSDNSNLDSNPNRSNNITSSPNQTIKMTSKAEFYKMCVQTFTDVYDGDPLVAHAFMRKIQTLEPLCEDETHKKILVDVIMSNVKGRALDVIPSDPADSKVIREAIKNKIKPEKSSIIEGRMIALKIDKGGFTEFSNKVEKLSDKYKHSLIAEGISKEKANEMTIAKAVSLCKSNARDIQVKTALTASIFSTVKDVITKYITVTQEETQNKQSVQNGTNAFHFRANNYQNRSRGHGRGNFNRNFNPNNNSNRNFNSNNNFNRNNSNYRQNSNNYRGNSRGNYQNNNNFQNGRGNFNRNKNSHTYAYQGNCQTPPSETGTNQNWRRADDVHDDN